MRYLKLTGKDSKTLGIYFNVTDTQEDLMWYRSELHRMLNRYVSSRATLTIFQINNLNVFRFTDLKFSTWMYIKENFDLNLIFKWKYKNNIVIDEAQVFYLVLQAKDI